ncbi:hypothetical protein GEMRC1_011328 [Eukaryota sp. GEM-RC1]
MSQELMLLLKSLDVYKSPVYPPPLQIAVESGNRAIAMFLMRKGADPRWLLDQWGRKVPGMENLFKDKVLKRMIESQAKLRGNEAVSIERKWHSTVQTTMFVNLAVSKFKKLLIVAKARKEANAKGEDFDPIAFRRKHSL